MLAPSPPRDIAESDGEDCARGRRCIKRDLAVLIVADEALDVRPLSAATAAELQRLGWQPDDAAEGSRVLGVAHLRLGTCRLCFGFQRSQLGSGDWCHAPQYIIGHALVGLRSDHRILVRPACLRG